MKIKNVTLDPKRVKAGPDDGLEEGQFLVYPSTFIKEPDSYGDIVKPGAFAEDIEAWKASGDVLPGLWGHRMDDPDFFIASTLDEGEDDHGWWLKGEFDLEHPKARQVYRLVKGRRVRQLSFAYDVLEEGKTTLEDGRSVNELRRLKRYEFSFVPVGANQDTGVVAVKAIAESLRSGRVLSGSTSIAALKEARDAIESVIAAHAAGGSIAPEEASDAGRTKDEDRESDKSEESRTSDSSVKARATLAIINSLAG